MKLCVFSWFGQEGRIKHERICSPSEFSLDATKFGVKFHEHIPDETQQRMQIVKFWKKVWCNIWVYHTSNIYSYTRYCCIDWSTPFQSCCISLPLFAPSTAVYPACGVGPVRYISRRHACGVVYVRHRSCPKFNDGNLSSHHQQQQQVICGSWPVWYMCDFFTLVGAMYHCSHYRALDKPRMWGYITGMGTVAGEEYCGCIVHVRVL